MQHINNTPQGSNNVLRWNCLIAPNLVYLCLLHIHVLGPSPAGDAGTCTQCPRSRWGGRPRCAPTAVPAQRGPAEQDLSHSLHLRFLKGKRATIIHQGHYQLICSYSYILFFLISFNLLRCADYAKLSAKDELGRMWKEVTVTCLKSTAAKSFTKNKTETIFLVT
jgi:hypothetical protein